MLNSSKLVLLLALFAIAWGQDTRAEKSTVCTITVNSADEKETFKRHLPENKFRFVELVEHGKPDWLASACQQKIQCDVLVISGHFAGTNFFSEEIDVSEYLPVEEMERVSCSDSCPGLFSRLKEVYLFGCNTLNPEADTNSSNEIARSLVLSGKSRSTAEKVARSLDNQHGESNRDRMRRIFKNVPVIYGFSSKAPVGSTAASLLTRYFDSSSGREVGSGRASPKLLNQFAANSMSVSSGFTDSDPHADYRRQVCQFYDERLAPSQKLTFIHQLLGQDMAKVRMFLDRMENFTAKLTDSDRQAQPISQALDTIASDQPARDRYLAFARGTDQPSTRARMTDLARTFGWLSPAEQREERMRIIDGVLSKNTVSPADVNFLCTLNSNHELDEELPRFQLPPAQASKIGQAAGLACYGSADGHARVLSALTAADAKDVEIAEVYLRHRPITDVAELRLVAQGIAGMSSSTAQVRALEALSRHYISDRESLQELMQLFPVSTSIDVQRAIAGIFIRSDFHALAKPELVRVLREHRLKSSTGHDLIDALIRRLSLS